MAAGMKYTDGGKFRMTSAGRCPTMMKRCGPRVLDLKSEMVKFFHRLEISEMTYCGYSCEILVVQAV